jgi:hypothetical protein
MWRSIFLLVPVIAGCSIRDATFLGTGDAGDDLGDGPAAVTELVVSEPALAIAEGQMGSFTVALGGVRPASDVMVTVTSDNMASVTATASLVFTPADFDQPQAVMVTTAADTNFDFATAALEISAPAIVSKTAMVVVTEPDIIEITPAMGVTCPGDSAAVSVRLRGNPLGALTVTTSIAGAAEVAPAAFPFDATTFGVYQNADLTGQVGPSTADIDFGGAGLTAKRYRLTIRSAGSPICLQ